MANPQFPNVASGTISTGEDSRNMGRTLEDPSVQSKMDGGYVVSRPKFTRRPRRTWTSGFTSISNSDREALENFWDAVAGGSVIFDWINPQDSQTYQVRFLMPSGFKFRYVGMGYTQLWDTTYTVEEA